ncbi:hypothetical protein VP01_2030g1 [Puccinia sorghi]|uniref:Uncharacterized protein n=1 Tax=Puccinia sorghi TaxID=27349 RepID=A0A0L6VB71_9BASI|nr:hypothetical protein VP01_2030g1 [Puccinia sorghi]
MPTITAHGNRPLPHNIYILIFTAIQKTHIRSIPRNTEATWIAFERSAASPSLTVFTTNPQSLTLPLLFVHDLCVPPPPLFFCFIRPFECLSSFSLQVICHPIISLVIISPNYVLIILTGCITNLEIYLYIFACYIYLSTVSLVDLTLSLTANPQKLAGFTNFMFFWSANLFFFFALAGGDADTPSPPAATLLPGGYATGCPFHPFPPEYMNHFTTSTSIDNRIQLSLVSCSIFNHHGLRYQQISLFSLVSNTILWHPGCSIANQLKFHTQLGPCWLTDTTNNLKSRNPKIQYNLCDLNLRPSAHMIQQDATVLINKSGYKSQNLIYEMDSTAQFNLWSPWMPNSKTPWIRSYTPFFGHHHYTSSINHYCLHKTLIKQHILHTSTTQYTQLNLHLHACSFMQAILFLFVAMHSSHDPRSELFLVYFLLLTPFFDRLTNPSLWLKLLNAVHVGQPKSLTLVSSLPHQIFPSDFTHSLVVIIPYNTNFLSLGLSPDQYLDLPALAPTPYSSLIPHHSSLITHCSSSSLITNLCSSALITHKPSLSVPTSVQISLSSISSHPSFNTPFHISEPNPLLKPNMSRTTERQRYLDSSLHSEEGIHLKFELYNCQVARVVEAAGCLNIQVNFGRHEGLMTGNKGDYKMFLMSSGYSEISFFLLFIPLFSFPLTQFSFYEMIKLKRKLFGKINNNHNNIIHNGSKKVNVSEEGFEGILESKHSKLRKKRSERKIREVFIKSENVEKTGFITEEKALKNCSQGLEFSSLKNCKNDEYNEKNSTDQRVNSRILGLSGKKPEGPRLNSYFQ